MYVKFSMCIVIYGWQCIAYQHEKLRTSIIFVNLKCKLIQDEN